MRQSSVKKNKGRPQTSKRRAKKAKLKRRYLQSTLKVLFALSGNQCAHPDCKNRVIVPPTEKSDTLVLNEICHIYSLAEDGPRGRAGLTEKELNAPENLILFCPTHHVIIDGQHETYPAELLKDWKRVHEAEMERRISADLKSIQPDVFAHPYFPTALVDQRIEEELASIRKSRFYVEYDTVQASLRLGRKLVEAELSGGTDAVRSRALAWCARLLCRREQLEKAEEFLSLAKTLVDSPDVKIAQAFLFSAKGDKNAALSVLAPIDTAQSRTASFMIVAHTDGAQVAIDWLHATGIEASDLDAEGKYLYLSQELDLGHWDAAVQRLGTVTDADRHEAPVLHHAIAITRLLTTVPEELRHVVFQQIPFELAGFPFSADASAQQARGAAHQSFLEAAQAARALDCPRAAGIAEDYALWLELRDQPATGKRHLEERLRDPKSSLRLVHLALQFGIELDLSAVEREIDRQIALNGGVTPDVATARFALAFTQKSPADVARYIARHRDELIQHLDPRAVSSLEIEMLARGGQLEKARERLDAMIEEGLPDTEAGRFRRLIAEGEGTDPVQSREEQFRKTGSLIDLGILVTELETHRAWDGVCEYGAMLFERTHSLQDALRLANALKECQRHEQLVAFLQSRAALRDQSRNLQMQYCWSLFHEGRLLEAQTELGKLADSSDDPNYRALQINLGISLGDWNALSALVEHERQEKDQRSAKDLIRAAQLALQLGSPHARELTFAAAEKGHDDPHILAGCYFLASNAGWEKDDTVAAWIRRAAALSGEDGPMQAVSLQELFDRKPEWDRRESETWRELGRGAIPMFVAAASLNRSLIDLTLYPALGNLSQRDPRRRGAILAYSGNRPPTQAFQSVSAIGIDGTALLTLCFLGLLETALDAFETVHVPHSLLPWLFEEKQKSAFHQPSRFKDARDLQHLLATDRLGRLLPSAVPDSDLAAQVGDDLALLIAEAEKIREEDTAQRLVVRPSPVHRLSSLMREEADLAAHARVLCSCRSVVDKLRQKAQITAEEEDRARAYLKVHEKAWPNEPQIEDGAVLYLDGLAVTYLLHLGILDRVSEADVRPMVAPDTVIETNQLIFYEGISSKVSQAIESIRSALHSRIVSGKIKVAREAPHDPSQDRELTEHPTFDVVTLVQECDLLTIDERFLNQHGAITGEGDRRIPLCTTLDLLDHLAAKEVISPEDRLRHRTQLRRAGYFFVPVDEEELAAHLCSCPVRDGRVIESTELKAIRENILRVRMSDWLQIPKEAPWLDALLKRFATVFKELWYADRDLATTRAYADWIFEQYDVRGWAHALGPENGANLIGQGRIVHIMMLLFLPIGLPRAAKKAYREWSEERILRPIQEEYPDLYAAIVEWHRQQVSEMANADLPEGGAPDGE